MPTARTCIRPWVLPTPKSAQTIVNVNQQAAAVTPAIVPLSSPESAIANLARAFNEARQAQTASAVRDTVTAQRDDTHDNEDES
jgi:hypothetical protein